MYYQAISQCTQMLKNLESWLNKAEEYAGAKTFDVGVLMTGRLAPDMKPFIYQVQSACDYVKAAAAWLSGQAPPKHEDNEQTIDELRARIRLRHPPPQRRRCRQDGFSWSYQSGRRLIGLGVPFKRSKRGPMSASSRYCKRLFGVL